MTAAPPRFVWPGKRAAIAAIAKRARGSLVIDAAGGLASEGTGNALVRGDNLEVLRHLRVSHAGAVKLIYIDPPYNTGSALPYADGISHAAWLSMMYPRLAIARELLRADGVLMASIGDDEVHRLRALLDELYGETNFCGKFVWEKKRKPSFLDARMTSRTEYVLTYARDRRAMAPLSNGTTTLGKMVPFNNAGNPLAVLVFPAGSVRFGFGDGVVEAQDMSAGNIRTRLLDSVEIARGTNVASFRLEGEWRYAQRTLDALAAAGAEIVVRRRPFRPNYIDRTPRAKTTANLLTIKGTGTPTYEDARRELRGLFGRDVLAYAKPLGLISYLVASATGGDDLVLDFFAGSGTTGHAVLDLNRRDGGRRRFLLVQNDEPTGLADLPTIFDLAVERLHRAAASMPDASARGFRVFRLRL